MRKLTAEDIVVLRNYRRFIHTACIAITCHVAWISVGFAYHGHQTPLSNALVTALFTTTMLATLWTLAMPAVYGFSLSRGETLAQDVKAGRAKL